MVRKSKKTRGIENPYPDDDSLYNIYNISFNNIMGSASGLYRSRTLVSLKDFELRLQDMITEFSWTHINGVILTRRVFESHSMLSWRIGAGSNRVYVDEKDERLIEFIQTLDEEDQSIMQPAMNEMALLNLNLRVAWTIYLEACRIAQVHEDEIVTPKKMPIIIDQLLGKA